ncbi:hypothetical protein CYMTET_8066 [Cymbomonas tetramitiformis]|uniref:Uncharacterized protein n=1 Tax=Cymbomonas tetramitiformis TaxID=36881 RepID=A0AAE0LG88_9CHLO|nr:hypothetical protein CYMTET_8066 [Cymbomonas tetramitiformis]
MAEEAKAMSQNHMKWMMETLRENNGSCTYEVLVEVARLRSNRRIEWTSVLYDVFVRSAALRKHAWNGRDILAFRGN